MALFWGVKNGVFFMFAQFARRIKWYVQAIVVTKNVLKFSITSGKFDNLEVFTFPAVEVLKK